MHSFLLRFLFLSVLFASTIGVPLHEARHLADIGHAVSSPIAQGEGDSDGLKAGSPLDEFHGACAWCRAFSSHATAPAPSLTIPGATPSRWVSAYRANAVVASAGRWRYASRDPPASLA